MYGIQLFVKSYIKAHFNSAYVTEKKEVAATN